MEYNLDEYKKYHSKRDNECLGLFLELAKKYDIKKALYPGSYVHITPSFVFPSMVYVDSCERAGSVFNSDDLLPYIKKRKIYDEDHQIVFYHQDYSKPINGEEKSFDLLISQYAGFVSQACRKYLKIGGILIANNSHGDASMANLDKDYKFVGVYNRKDDRKYTISGKNLDLYFMPKKDIKETKDVLEKSMRGTGYTKSPSGYIFQRIQ